MSSINTSISFSKYVLCVSIYGIHIKYIIGLWPVFIPFLEGADKWIFMWIWATDLVNIRLGIGRKLAVSYLSFFAFLCASMMQQRLSFKWECRNPICWRKPTHPVSNKYCIQLSSCVIAFYIIQSLSYNKYRFESNFQLNNMPSWNKHNRPIEKQGEILK
jgi:hypothetical protein